MKISSSDFDMIKVACLDTLKAHNLHPFMVQNTRHAYEVFSRACNDGRLDMNALYKTYDDNHIQTALKKIFLNRA